MIGVTDVTEHLIYLFRGILKIKMNSFRKQFVVWDCYLNSYLN